MSLGVDDHDGRLTISLYDARHPSESRWTKIVLDAGGLIEFAQGDKRGRW